MKMGQGEGRTGKAIRNILWNYGNQIVMLILSFLSRTVFIWVFGVEYLGLNGIFSDLLGMLSLTDLGLNSAMVYSFYKPLAERDYQKVAALVAFYRKIYLKIAMAVLFLGLCLIPFLPYIIHTNQVINHLNIYYLFSLSNVVASYLFVYKTAILTADQKNYIIVRINIVVNIIKVLVQIVTMLLFANYILYLALDLCGNLTSNLIASKYTVKKYPFLQKKEPLSNADKKNIRNTIFSGFLYKVSSVLLNATDNLLISILVSTAAVGYYSNYLMIQSKITLFYSMIFTSAIASIGNLMVQAAVERRYQIFQMEQTVSFIACFVFIPCYILLINDFISLWLGASFLFDKVIVFAIGLNMYLGCVLQPLWSYREATGLYRRTKYVMLVCAFLNMILSIILGKIWGVFGILLASAIARVSTYVWYEPRILFKEYFHEDAKKYYIELARESIYIITLVYLLNLLCDMCSIETWFQWGIKAIVLSGLCLLIGILLHYRSKGFSFLKEKCYKIYYDRRG